MALQIGDAAPTSLQSPQRDRFKSTTTWATAGACSFPTRRLHPGLTTELGEVARLKRLRQRNTKVLGLSVDPGPRTRLGCDHKDATGQTLNYPLSAIPSAPWRICTDESIRTPATR